MLLSPNRRTVSVILERMKAPKTGTEGDTGMGAADGKRAMMEAFTDLEPGEGSPEEQGADEDACISACETILDAFKSNDPQALHEALQDYLTLAEDYGKEDKESESD